MYAYIDNFSEKLDNKNSYIKNCALILLSCNAKRDFVNKIDLPIFRYLQHITDEKTITSIHCIEFLLMFAEYKQTLKIKIAEKLRDADVSAYTDSMRPLAEKEVQDA